MNALSIFLSGISMATFAASGIFFLKFWKASRDRFYLLFCAACWCLSFERIVLLIVHNSQYPQVITPSEANSWVYFFRLTAFLIILFAVVDKNRNTKNLT